MKTIQRKAAMLVFACFAFTICAGMPGSVRQASAMPDLTAPHGEITDFARLRLDRMAAYLELSEFQVKEIRTAVQKEWQTVMPVIDQLKENRAALFAMARDGFNEKLVQEIANEQSALLAELIVTRQRIRSTVAALLTPEQLEKTDKLRLHARSRFHGLPAGLF